MPRKRPAPKRHQHGGTQTLRIIGGEWRGRKLTFPDVDGLRPTPDRIRETLFNWLPHQLDGQTVLDCFTGSGALGFEALSRGAKHVTFIDTSPLVTASIKEHISTLNVADRASVVKRDANDWLSSNTATGHCFDLVFLDPPFNQDLLPPLLTSVTAAQHLNDDALLYVEFENSNDELKALLQSEWQVLKSKSAGQVCYNLISPQ